MRLFTWNVRGLNAPNKQRLLKHCLNSLKSDIILIQETKLSTKEINKLSRKLGIWQIDGVTTNTASRGLAILWDPRRTKLEITIKNQTWMGGWVRS